MRPRRRARAALLAGLSLVLLGACGLTAETPASPPGTPGTSQAPGTPEKADRYLLSALAPPVQAQPIRAMDGHVSAVTWNPADSCDGVSCVTPRAACRRWHGDLAWGAYDTSKRDTRARLARVAYRTDENAREVVATLLMAGRPLLHGLDRPPHPGCVTAVPGVARLGDSTRAYRFPAEGEERGGQTWVKEIRFGSYLLQVRLTAAFDTTPVRGFPRGTMASPVRAEELESYAASIFQHATRVTAARTPMPPPMPPPGGPRPSFSATGPAARDPRGFLGRVPLPEYRDLRPGGPVPTRVTQDGPVDAAGRAWLGAYTVPGVTKPDCLPTAGGMWQAAAAEQVRGPRPWIAVRSLTAPDGFFVTETVVWWSTVPGRGLEASPSALACGSFAHRGGTVRTKVIMTPALGDSSRAFQVLTGDGDAPTLVHWVWAGRYSIEVRIGTQGNRASSRVRTDILVEVSRAALERALENMP